VIFQEQPVEVRPEESKSTGKSKRRPGKAVEGLQRELDRVRENLQATIEESQATNEELRSTNEELQSTNEELQSTNEEMETSKEELQSLNEELVTLNAEMTAEIERAVKLENDMKNVLDSLRVGIIFLDSNLHIRQFTPEATRLVHLIQTDVGRPIGHLASNIQYENLAASAQAVLETLIPKEVEVRSRDGHWFLMRILPYRTLDNVIDGLVVTFDDITRLKMADQEMARADSVAQRNTESLLQSFPEPVIVLDAALQVRAANESFYATFQLRPEDIEGRPISRIANGQWNSPYLRDFLAGILTKGAPRENTAGALTFPGLGKRRFEIRARMIRPQDTDTNQVLLSIVEKSHAD
jgi:two-component system CheB/CheR fusion protein